MHRTAIMVHYWEVTEMEQRVVIDVGAGADCHYSIYWAESGETLPTKWPRSPNMAPAARSKWFTSDDGHKMLTTFICCVRVFRIPRVATQSKQSDCTGASSQQSVWVNIYTWHLSHCTVQDVNRSVRNSASRIMYKNTANSHTEHGWLHTTYCYTERGNSTWSYSLSSLHNTHQIQKQQWRYIHINNNYPSKPPRVTAALSARFMRLKMRPEDQLHCVSVTTPFRGAITVLEVVTPNPLVSKEKRKVSLSFCTGQGSLEVHGFFIRPRRLQGFTDKKMSVRPGLFPSLNGTDKGRRRYRKERALLLCLVCDQNVWDGKRSAERQKQMSGWVRVSWLTDWSDCNCVYREPKSCSVSRPASDPLAFSFQCFFLILIISDYMTWYWSFLSIFLDKWVPVAAILFNAFKWSVLAFSSNLIYLMSC